MTLNNNLENTFDDGRVAVLLLLLTCILTINLAKMHEWSFRTGSDDYIAGFQLGLLKPNLMVFVSTEKQDNFQDNVSISPRFSPFFFQKIPINSADKEMLMTIQGIGPALAESIIEYRHRYGPIKDSKELQNIHGIGPKLAIIFSTAFSFK